MCISRGNWLCYQLQCFLVMKGRFTENLKIRDFRLPSWCSWVLCSAGLLRSVSWYLFTKISWTAWPLKMGQTAHHKTPVNKYQSTPCKNPEKQRPQAWKWWQHDPLKQWYLSTRTHGVTVHSLDIHSQYVSYSSIT